MPKVEIQRSRSRLPSQTNFAGFSGVDITSPVGDALQRLGATVSAFGQDKINQARQVESDEFVFRENLNAKQHFMTRQQELSKEFAGNPSGLADAMKGEILSYREDVLTRAPNQQAARTFSSQYQGTASNVLVSTAAVERQLFVESKIDSVQGAKNTLENNVRLNPDSIFFGEDEEGSPFVDLNNANNILKQVADPVKMKAVSVEDKKNLYRSALDGFIDRGLGQAEGFERGDILELEKAKELVASKEVSSLFSAEEVEQLDRRVEIAFSTAQSQTEAAKQEVGLLVEEAINSSLLKEGVTLLDTHEARTNLQAAIDNGVISAGSTRHEKLFNKIKQAEDSVVEMQNASSFVNQARGSESVIDSSDSKQVKMTEKMYNAEFGGKSVLQEEDEGTRVRMLDFIRDMGYLPNNDRAALTHALEFSGGETSATAAHIINELSQEQFVARNFTNEQLSRASLIKGMMDANADPEEISNQIRAAESQSSNPEAVKKARSRIVTAMSSKGGRKTMLSTWEDVTGTSNIPPEAEAEIEQLAKSYGPQIGVFGVENVITQASQAVAKKYTTVKVGNKDQALPNIPAPVNGAPKDYAQKQIDLEVDQFAEIAYTEHLKKKREEEGLSEDVSLKKFETKTDKANFIKQFKDDVFLVPTIVDGEDRLMVMRKTAAGHANVIVDDDKMTIKPDPNESIEAKLASLTRGLEESAKNMILEGDAKKAGLMTSFFGKDAGLGVSPSESTQPLIDMKKKADHIVRGLEALQRGAYVGGAPLGPSGRASIMRDIASSLEDIGRIGGLQPEDTDTLEGGESSDDLGGGEGDDTLGEVTQPPKPQEKPQTKEGSFFMSMSNWEGRHGYSEKVGGYKPMVSNDKKDKDSGRTTYDIGYGHKITPQEWDSGMIHGHRFLGDNGKPIPLSEEQIQDIKARDIEQNLDTALANGWSDKLADRGLSWTEIPLKYKLPLIDLAYNVGGSKAQEWTNIFDAIRLDDPAMFVGELRRTDSDKNTEGMDNRAAKAAHAAGLISSLEEARKYGLKLATDIGVKTPPKPTNKPRGAAN